MVNCGCSRHFSIVLFAIASLLNTTVASLFKFFFVGLYQILSQIDCISDTFNLVRGGIIRLTY